MRVSRTRRIAAAALLVWGLGDVGAVQSQNRVAGVNVKPRPVCMGPRRPPDLAVPAPEVVSTFPEEGAVVRPGLLILRFTFNVPMSCDGLFQKLEPLALPCTGGDVQWTTLTYDRTTIRMPCMVRPNTKYGLWMNYGRDRGLQKSRFSSLAGQPLQSFKLTFSTSPGPEVKDVKTADAEDSGWPRRVR